MKYLILILLVVPLFAFAQIDEPPGYSPGGIGSVDTSLGAADSSGWCPTIVPESCRSGQCNYDDLLLMIGNIFTFITKCLAVPVATIVIAWGGILMVISPADTGKRETGKKMLWAAVLGLVITLAALLIVDTVLDALLNPNNAQFKNPLN